MQSLSASMRASWWEHLLHTCPPSSLCRGLGCSLRWPSTMGRARDSPGRCSTDLLAGCPLHPGDSALGPPTKDDLLTLQELLSRSSGANKSTVGHLGDPHWSAPQEQASCCLGGGASPWSPRTVLARPAGLPGLASNHPCAVGRRLAWKGRGGHAESSLCLSLPPPAQQPPALPPSQGACIAWSLQPEVPLRRSCANQEGAFSPSARAICAQTPLPHPLPPFRWKRRSCSSPSPPAPSAPPRLLLQQLLTCVWFQPSHPWHLFLVLIASCHFVFACCVYLGKPLSISPPPPCPMACRAACARGSPCCRLDFPDSSLAGGGRKHYTPTCK
ncbi:hypothetical protein E2320_011850 [Naja naja]|nr:hypothetical protein E2320_011850 [Naja naja]